MSCKKEKILNICKNEYSYFLCNDNIQGIGLGCKVKNGKYTNEECIKVFVKKKLSTNRCKGQEIIPLYYKGIKTDVIEDGIARGCYLRNRVRPVTGGYSISPTKGGNGGTFGCLVTDGKYYYVLSNNHVMAYCNDNPLGVTIVQPSMAYGGKEPQDVIANLSRYEPLKFSDPLYSPENLVDCAMAKITKRSLVSTKITLLGRIKGVEKAKLHETVQKVGSASELTKGEITTIGVTRRITLCGKSLLFKDQIMTTKMADGGDSGSILLDNNMNAIGLVMAGTQSSTTINPIEYVLKSLNVQIVTG